MPSPKAITDLPEPLISRVLLASTDHDDLLLHASACARVGPNGACRRRRCPAATSSRR
jgi:hypothetical protein